MLYFVKLLIALVSSRLISGIMYRSLLWINPDRVITVGVLHHPVHALWLFTIMSGSLYSIPDINVTWLFPLPCAPVVWQAAAQHHCSYLVSLHSTHFLRVGGDPVWLQGLEAAPPRLRLLDHINKVLAHQPWLTACSHIQVRPRETPMFSSHPWPTSCWNPRSGISRAPPDAPYP